MRTALGALLGSIVLAACGSSNRGSSGPGVDGGPPSDTGASSGSDGNGGACAASGQSCETATCCGGDCLRGTRINGKNGTLCVDRNVDYGATCAPAPCGGDPSGTWTVVASACGNATCGTPGTGAIALNEPLVIGPGGGQISLDVVYRFAACGWIDEGNDNVDGTLPGAAADAAAPTMPYCVQGSTLWLLPDKSFGHTVLTAVKLTR